MQGFYIIILKGHDWIGIRFVNDFDSTIWITDE